MVHQILVHSINRKQMILAVLVVSFAAIMQCMALIRFSNALLTGQDKTLISVSQWILILASVTGMFFYWILITLLSRSAPMAVWKIKTDFRILLLRIGLGFIVFILSYLIINIILNGFLKEISTIMLEQKNIFQIITTQTGYKIILRINQAANGLLWIWCVLVIIKTNRLTTKKAIILFIILCCIFGLLMAGFAQIFRS